MSPTRLRRFLTFAVALLMALVGAGTWTGVAAADDEGGTASLRQQLDEATRGYVDANAKLEASKARQEQLNNDLATVESRFATESIAVGEMAASTYRMAGFTAASTIVASGSPADFIDQITLLNALANREEQLVRKLSATRDEVNTAKAAIDTEVAAQQEQATAMAARKQQAERALAAVGGGQATGGTGGSSSIVAEPAPRNPDGSWPAESCSVYEDVTGGCITPRMAHAREQAQVAGFTHYVSCYRSNNDGGEHPKGRACDFAANINGFVNADAFDSERTYGNNLAAFFIFNASRLGVLYVIWYRQIWLPGSGWRSYTGCCGPSAEHTNHVHLSVY